MLARSWSHVLKEWTGVDQIAVRAVLENRLGFDSLRDFAEIKLLLRLAFDEDAERTILHEVAIDLLKPVVCYHVLHPDGVRSAHLPGQRESRR